MNKQQIAETTMSFQLPKVMKQEIQKQANEVGLSANAYIRLCVMEKFKREGITISEEK